MAETIINCPYRGSGRNLVLALSVAWCLGLMAALFWSVHFLYIEFLPFIFIFGSIILIAPPFFALQAIEDGSFITAAKEGLTLPSGMFGMGSKRVIPWRNIRFVDYSAESNRILLVQKEGQQIVVEARALGESLGKFMLALEMWSDKAEWSSLALLKREDCDSSAAGGKSFTRLWDEELQRRYSSTNFVPLEPGRELQDGRFTVSKQLGFGGFSAVYLAQQGSGDKVVLKESIFSHQSGGELDTSSAKQLELFSREAKILRTLRHPNIAGILDEFVENNRSYLVIEYIAGETLRQRVQRLGALNCEQIYELIPYMVRILRYLHGHQPPIIHRDFTPDNLILDQQNNLFLIDFGAANELIEKATGTFVGRQSYMPMEQVRGRAVPDTDYYALGCTLAFLLTGADPQPLAQPDLKSVRQASSEPLCELIEELTNLEPGDRIAAIGRAEKAGTVSEI